MKKILSILLAVALLLSLAACGASENGGSDQTASNSSQTEENQTQDNQSSGDTITVVDHLDRTVEVPAKIERIAVCDIYPLPSVLSIFFDSAEKIVGMAGPSMTAAQNSLLSELYPEILNAETGFIDGNQVNMEELLKLQPDVVFFSASEPEQGRLLEENGFAAVAISVNKWDYDAIETLNQWIALLSQIFPDNDKTATVQAASEEIYQMIQERLADLPEEERQQVFFLFQYDQSQILTSGAHFFGQWWADSIGTVNVAQEIDKDNSVPVNLEQVYAWNPDVIFITNFTTAQPEDLYQNTVGTYDWSGIDAVKNQRVYKMPLGMYRSYTPGVDTPITLLWLAKTVYPELFEDIDLTEQVVAYYEDVFGVTLTAEQAEQIFTPTAQAGEGF